MSRILWIDDNDTTTSLVGEKLEQRHELTVLPYLSRRTSVKARDFDLVVLDLFIDRKDDEGTHRENGLVYLSQLMKADSKLTKSVEDDDTRWLLLSQHLAEYELREFIKTFTEENDIRAFLRSKNQESAVPLNRRDAIASIIEEVLRDPSSPRLVEEVDRLLTPPKAKGLFSIALDEFRNLPDSVQAELQEQALESTEVKVDAFFAANQTADWAILAGESGEVVNSGTMDKLPSARERRALAEKRGHPILITTRSQGRGYVPSPATVEEVPVWPRNRSHAGPAPQRCEGVMQDYPTFVLELGGGERHYHFDTGADSSFIRASHAREHGVSLDVETRLPGKSRFGRYFQYELPADGLDCNLIDHEQQSHISVTIEGFAIEQYQNWEHSRRCRENDCELGSGGDPCIVRSGLIGRRLLRDNAIAVEISPASTHAHFRRL